MKICVVAGVRSIRFRMYFALYDKPIEIQKATIGNAKELADKKFYIIRIDRNSHLQIVTLSPCFLSLCENIRISPMSAVKNCFSTVLPNEPVSPVIINVAPLNGDIFCSLFYYATK